MSNDEPIHRYFAEVADRNRARKRMRDAGEPQVGIFLFVQEPEGDPRILGSREFLQFAKQTGCYLTGHEDYEALWNSLEQTMCPGWPLGFLRGSEYKAWPHGRAVFHTERKRFEVYLDSRLQEPWFEEAILDFFHLPRGEAVFLPLTGDET